MKMKRDEAIEKDLCKKTQKDETSCNMIKHDLTTSAVIRQNENDKDSLQNMENHGKL